MREFASNLEPATSAATVITLSGDLGAGKTTFTQLLAKQLGVTSPVSSPTFVISKTYPLENADENNGFENLIHIDAYRLGDPHELELIGFNQQKNEVKNLIVVEWPSLVSLQGDINISIEHDSRDESRNITIS